MNLNEISAILAALSIIVSVIAAIINFKAARQKSLKEFEKKRQNRKNEKN